MLTLLTIAVFFVLRCMVGFWGYSGAGQYPMFGDFEAQRHWLEITIALPIGDWYRNVADNDLQYWGLDYPPLTAYVSYMFGKIAEVLVPGLVRLYYSRGYETYEGKLFMRASVLMCDAFVLLPSILFAFAKMNGKRYAFRNLSITNKLQLLSLVLVPSLIIIDHGHFQYNGVCIGLSIIGAMLIVSGHQLAGSVFFCLSLNFKQMSLYYAPVFFFALLRISGLKSSSGSMMNVWVVGNVVLLGITVIATFAFLWWPFCAFASANETCVSSLLHVLSRQFPFARGIFEDKVSNIWYVSSVVIDHRKYFTKDQLVGLSLSLTSLLLTPVCIDLLNKDSNPKRIMLALTNSSLAFFLASYQVHEKSVLLALVPAAFLITSDPILICWFQIIGTFSMFPLLRRDVLIIPYYNLCGIYICVTWLMIRSKPSLIYQYTVNPHDSDDDDTVEETKIKDRNNKNNMEEVTIGEWMRHIKRLFVEYWPRLKIACISLSCIGMILLHVMEKFLAPPLRFPDLYPALFSIFGMLNLLFMYGVGISWQLSLPNETMSKISINKVKIN